MLRKTSTLLLKATLVFMALIILIIASLALPSLFGEAAIEFPYAPNAALGIVIVLYSLIIPYLYVLWQSWKLLILIDQNKGFSLYSVMAFRRIKFASLIGGLLLMIGFVPPLYPIAQGEDAPGLLVYGFLFACIPFIVSVFAGVLEKLFQNAVEMKSENDLTI